MLEMQSRTTTGKTPRLSLSLAHSDEQLLAAQRLRYQIFAGEMGAQLSDDANGLDQDRYDAFCEHLLVHDEQHGDVVGTYRILPPHQAHAAGGYYSENEFDLGRLRHLRHSMVELGRSCVHPDYRQGGTITLLWAGIADYMQRNGYQYLIGCASVPLFDGGTAARQLYQLLQTQALAPAEWRVFPRNPLPLAGSACDNDLAVPPLIKGYLRAGAMVCGEPNWDPEFNSADFLMLLPMQQLNPRYARHFQR